MSDRDAPPPPFRLSRESRIRIDREGRFWHEGARVEHARLARALASWLTVDEASGRYVLRNSLDWCFITVEDAPLVVTSLAERDGRLEIALTDGTTETLDVSTVRLDEDDVPYADVRGGSLPARFSRGAAYDLLSRVEPEADGGALALPGGGRAPLRRVARGSGAARRPAASASPPPPRP